MVQVPLEGSTKRESLAITNGAAEEMEIGAAVAVVAVEKRARDKEQIHLAKEQPPSGFHTSEGLRRHSSSRFFLVAINRCHSFLLC